MKGEQDELPAYSVDIGPLELIEQLSGGIVRARLAVFVTSIALDPSESVARELVIDMQRQAHIAILGTAQTKLGLASFVDFTTFDGWPEPLTVEFDGDEALALLLASYLVDFRMNLTDPGDG